MTDAAADPPGAVAAARRPSRARLAGWARTEALYLVEILALCSFTFTRPVLEIFGDDPQTFLAQGASRATVVLFALGVALMPGLALWAAAATTRVLGVAARRISQAAVLGGVAVLFTHTELARAVGWGPAAVWTVAAVAGAAVGALFWYAPPFRSFLHFASLSAPVFVALFVVSSPVSQIFDSSSAHAALAGSRRPVVWLVFDELPTASLLDGHGRIDAGLFPNFAELAGDATWYRNNTTVGTVTQNAVPAIMTGRYATTPYTVPVSSNYPESVFSLLGGSYRMHVSERVTHVCPDSLCASAVDKPLTAQLSSLWREARRIWPEYARKASGGDAPKGFSIGGDPVDTQRVPAFHDFLRGVATTRGPRLDFAHVLLPHQPWELLPDEKSYDAKNDGMVFFAWGSPDAARIARQRHLLQLQLADRYLGEVLARLHQRGTYDDSVIVVTADHGAAFSEARLNRALNDDNLVDIAFTPLIIKSPGQRAGRVDDRNAQTVDVLPTVADMLDIRIPWKVDGVSLLGRPRPDDTKTIVVTPREPMKPDDDHHRHHFSGTSPFRELIARPAASAPGPEGLRIFATGELGHLVGRPVSAFATGGPSRYRARFLEGGRDYRPSSGRAPVYYRTKLDAPKGTPVVIAVNGRIGAWMRIPGPSWFDADHWGLVPESFLRRGENDVRLYELDGPDDRPVLHPIATG